MILVVGSCGRLFKPRMQAVLKRMGLYHRMKASFLYDGYWALVDRRVIRERRDEVAFYRRTLRGFKRGDLFFDIGANEGHKTDVFLRMGARVVAVEPDDLNQEVLRKSFLDYRMRKRAVTIVGKAVSEGDGVATLWVDAPGSAKNTLNRKWVETLRNDAERFGARLTFASQRETATVSLESLIAGYGVPFFVKIDVEGHEPEVIRGLHQPVPYLSFEVNLPEFRREGEQCVELVAALASGATFNYFVDGARGLILEDWVDRQRFLAVLGQCRQKSIEVFCRAGDADSARRQTSAIMAAPA